MYNSDFYEKLAKFESWNYEKRIDNWLSNFRSIRHFYVKLLNSSSWKALDASKVAFTQHSECWTINMMCCNKLSKKIIVMTFEWELPHLKCVIFPKLCVYRFSRGVRKNNDIFNYIFFKIRTAFPDIYCITIINERFSFTRAQCSFTLDYSQWI